MDNQHNRTGTGTGSLGNFEQLNEILRDRATTNPAYVVESPQMPRQIQSDNELDFVVKMDGPEDEESGMDPSSGSKEEDFGGEKEEEDAERLEYLIPKKG